jgi:hypothetical protein
MKATGFGLTLGFGLLVAAVVLGGPQAGAVRQMQDRAVPSDQLIVLSFDLGDGRQQVTMVDPRQHVMAVYHVDKADGGIALKSVRNVQWDLLMEDFNSAGAPTPREVRAITQQR